jgi:hypothetical protein
MKKSIYFIIIFLLPVSFLYPQNTEELDNLKNARTKYKIKTLVEFNRILTNYSLMCTKYNEYNKVKDSLPVIEKAIEGVCNTSFPDILSDKNNKFEKCKNALREYYSELKNASDGDNREKFI